MAKRFPVSDVRQQLPSLLKKVEQHGEEIIVTRQGKDIARLSPLEPAAQGGGPQIIALTSLKGGVGKTTLAMHLARVLADEGRQVVVLDADSELSATRWRMQVGEISPQPLPFQVVTAERDQIMQQVRGLKAQDFTVILDTPPNDREMLRSAATIADLVLVPVLPTALDVDRGAVSLRLLEDMGFALPNLRFAALLNRASSRQRQTREADEVLNQTTRVRTVIPQLTAYQEAFGLVPKNLSHMAELWEEIKARFGNDL